MPLTPLVLGSNVSTNLNTDAESTGNVTGGVYFYNHSVHCYPGRKFATIGQARFNSGGFLVGKDTNVNAVSNTDCFGISLLRFDTDRSCHVLASLQLTGSEDSANPRWQYLMVPVSPTVTLMRWSCLVSIDSDDIPVYIAFGEVEIDSAAETLTENTRGTVTSGSGHIHADEFADLAYTMDSDGRVMFVSKTNSGTLKTGMADTITGTITHDDVALGDLPAPGASPNWNQGDTAMWRDETGTAWQRTSTRQSSAAGADWDIWQDSRVDEMWPAPTNIAPNVDPDDPWVVNLYRQGNRIGRQDLYSSGEVYLNVVGTTYEMGPVDGSNPTTQAPPLNNKIVDPESFTNLDANGYPNGSEPTKSLVVGLSTLTGTVTPIRVREYLANGVEHGAWRLTGTSGNRIFPCDVNRQYFVQASATATNLVIWFTATPNPLPTAGPRWWAGVAGSG